MTKRFEVIDYFDSKNKPIKAIRNTKTTEIYSMDNELEANSTCECFNALHKENEQLKQYKDAVLNCDSSKIIRVNRNTGEVDLIDKEYSDES